MYVCVKYFGLKNGMNRQAEEDTKIKKNKNKYIEMIWKKYK